MRIVDNHFNSIIEKFNEQYNFKVIKEHFFNSFKANGLNGSIREYYDEKAGMISIIKTRNAFWRIRTYSCIISPIALDGLTCFIEYHIKNGSNSIQVRLYDTIITADNDYKTMKNKVSIIKARYNYLSDSKINDLDNEDIILDLTIGKKAPKKEASELIKISNSYIKNVIDFMDQSPKVGEKAKIIRISKFLGYELKNDGYLFSSMRKVFKEDRANNYIKEFFIGKEK